MEPFSDCIFSIVATLLVIELKLPDSASVWHSLALIAPKILAFILSFIIVGMYWVAHHSMFNFVRKVDRNFLWLNNLNLLCVTFLPFPTAVLGSHPFETGAICFYAITLILANGTLTIAFRYLARHPELAQSNLTPELARRMERLVFLPIILYLAAIPFSYLEPIVSLAIFVITPAFYIIPNPWFKKAVGGGVSAQNDLHHSHHSK